jgi:hypothetical protein
MTNEQIDMTPNYDSIPLKERLDFQRELILNMLGTDFRSKPRTEQILKEIEWAEKYARKVSEIIDNLENEEIRKLVLSEDYAEACILVLNMLDKDKNK